MRRLLVVSAIAVAMASPAHADGLMSAVGKSWSCVKESAKSAAKISIEVAKKGATIAEIGANATACTAVQGGNAAPYVATLGAISAIKAASPSTIPTGSCASSVKGVVSKPFAEGLSALMPPSGVRDKLMSLIDSELAKEQLWNAITGIPGVQPYTMQVDCACTTIDGGISLTDIEEVSDAVNQASDSCADALDSLGLGFINDLGNAVGDAAEAAYSSLSGAYDELINGESDPAPYEVVYQNEFGRNRDFYATKYGLSPNHDNFPEMANAIDGCAGYYDVHKHSLSNGRKICTDMAKRLNADARALGLRFAEERRALEYVGKQWTFVFPGHWAWRLPPMLKPGSFPPNGDDGASVLASTTQDNSAHPFYPAIEKAGGELLCQDKYKSRLWACAGTGIFAAARQAYVAVKDYPTLMRASEAAISSGVRVELIKGWDANRPFIGNYYLHMWYKQPPMGGVFGCPSGGPLAEACKADLRKSFDTICYSGIRDAIVHAPVATLKPMQPQKNMVATCRAVLDERIALAGRLASKSQGLNPGTLASQLCARYSPRTPEMETCQKLISDAYDRCALDAVKAGPTLGVSPFNACWDKSQADLKANIATKVTVLHPPKVTAKPPTGQVTAPPAGSIKPAPKL